MTSYSALSPVSAAIYTALNVPALTDLAPGGVSDVIQQGKPYPMVFFEVSEPRQFGEGYAKLTTGCNACHGTTDHPFVVIKAPDSAAAFSNQDFRLKR